MPHLTKKDIEKYFELNTSEGPWQNREWLATLLDLQEMREDLKELCEGILGWDAARMVLGNEAHRLKQKYGWEEGT